MRNPIRGLYPPPQPDAEVRVVEPVFLTTLMNVMVPAENVGCCEASHISFGQRHDISCANYTEPVCIVQVTTNANGAVQKIIGPLPKSKAQRAERHLLLHWKRWYRLMMDEPGSPSHLEMIHAAMEIGMNEMWQDCELDTDMTAQQVAEWMERHPLPNPSSENMQ